MNTIYWVMLAAGTMIAVERMVPASQLPPVPGWWLRVALLNGCQATVAYVGAQSWDHVMAGASLGQAHDWPLWIQVVLGYVVLTFIYYWWHRARHELPLLWRAFHQVHHSPTRLEVVMAFYKHPAEIVMNGMLSSLIVYLLVGVDSIAAVLIVLVTGLAELFYHWNVRTPHWLGYFIQRPEMHRVHHQRDHHADNYSDLPVWDMLFGTFNNPRNPPEFVGFGDGNERRILDMLLGRVVS